MYQKFGKARRRIGPILCNGSTEIICRQYHPLMIRHSYRSDAISILGHRSKATTMISIRLFLWSLFAVFLLTGSTTVGAQEDLEEVPSQQRRQLWDFFSFISLRKSTIVWLLELNYHGWLRWLNFVLSFLPHYSCSARPAMHQTRRYSGLGTTERSPLEGLLARSDRCRQRYFQYG